MNQAKGKMERIEHGWGEVDYVLLYHKILVGGIIVFWPLIY